MKISCSESSWFEQMFVKVSSMIRGFASASWARVHLSDHDIKVKEISLSLISSSGYDSSVCFGDSL